MAKEKLKWSEKNYLFSSKILIAMGHLLNVVFEVVKIKTVVRICRSNTDFWRHEKVQKCSILAQGDSVGNSASSRKCKNCEFLAGNAANWTRSHIQLRLKLRRVNM